MRRFFTIDKYNTWHDWRLTLTGKEIEPAEPKTSYVELDGMSGSLDLTEALTGGVVYSDRTLTAAFMTSEGTYAEREARLRAITAALHGRKVRIIEPDDPEHYYLGRVRVIPGTKHPAYTELELQATCDPWRYAVNETERLVEVDGEVDVVLTNHGDKTVVPIIKVAGNVTLIVNGGTTELLPGTYWIADLKLEHGANVVGLTGRGTVTFKYREASL